MGFNVDGYVLKSARSAPSNATSTAPMTSGVLREHANLPGSYDFPGTLVEVAADQYRVGIKGHPGETTQEYLLWAANASNLAVLEDPSWAVDQGSGDIPAGTILILSSTTDVVGVGGFTAGVPGVSNPTVATGGAGTFVAGDLVQVDGADDPANDGLFEVLSHVGTLLTIRGVGTTPTLREDTGTQFVTDAVPAGSITKVAYSDGADRVVVTDDDDRSIAGVLSVSVVRGDAPLVTLTFTTFASQDADAGIVTLDTAALTSLGGGLSRTRGDTVTSVSYYLAAQKFWWTRNDSYLQRFGWDGATQRWAPFRGAPPLDLGEVREDGDYVLSPHPSRFSIGDMLPGDVLTPDGRAMVRVGRRPDADSTPARVLVVSDDEASVTYPSWPVGVDAVVGVSSGVLQWNPAFVATSAGQHSWYISETFPERSGGVLGELKGSVDEPLFLCPIPGPTDYPFLRIGSRRHLRAVMADTDADLDVLAVAEGEVGWSLTTGRLKLSSTDVSKADPDDAGFDLLYLDAVVVYDGVSLTSLPVGTRAPVQVVDSTGTATTVDLTKELYLPASDPLPSPGTSGVVRVPDGTGVTPTLSIAPSTRPNGSGLLRQISGVGDMILFGAGGCVEKVEVVEFDSDLPLFPFLLPKGEARVAVELGTGGSRIALGLMDRIALDGQPLYFLQADVQPAVFVDRARLVSRVMEPYVLSGDEVFAFAIDGTTYLWNAALLGAGSYTADAVAASLSTVITGSGSASSLLGRVVLAAGNLSTGSVEIGFGSTSSGAFVDRDLSGCSPLGFLPGWRVRNPSVFDNWLPDAGFAFGVFRSPKNLDRSQSQADFKARGRFRDAVFSRKVTASPVFFLNNQPLLDVAGYDEGVFFQTVEGLFRKSLLPFEDVLYDFENGRFSWLTVGGTTAGVAAPLTSLDLGGQGVVGSTLHPAVGDGYGLYTDEAGAPFVLQTLETDYLLDHGGAPGTATLIERVGDLAVVGSRGSFSAGGTTFTDPEATFVTDGVAPGYLLEVTASAGTAVGSYVVASVTGETTLEVAAGVPFLEAGDSVPWEVRVGFEASVFDPALLVDVLYEQFNHLPEEPFAVRVLSPLGTVPLDAASQAANRLQAVVAEALTSERPISVRFGQASGSPEATLTIIRKTKLGTVANGSLVVPDVTDEHFTTAAFSIRVGGQDYVVGTNLTGVNAFSEPLAGDQVEYGLPSSSIEGQLNFGEDILDDLAESLVYYVQEFTDPADLGAGEAEVDPTSGDLNLSAADMVSYGGTTDAYFVERMITEDRLDVVIGPMQGAVFFKRPLRAMQLVEVSYFQADVSGNQVLDEDGNPTEIIEFLPLYVRLEEATYVSDFEWALNPTGRTVRDDIDPQVWVNNRLQNYGNVPTVTLDASTSRLKFTTAVASGSVVKVSYAVNEAFGGEQGYTVSTPPVYRPPFFLLADESTFDLDTDRTADMVPGKILRVGAAPFYVKSASYDVTTDVTTVDIFPTPDKEAGSRAPGNDVLTLLSSMPVTTSVDGVATSGPAGFLLTLTATYEPVDAGMVSIIFRGNVTRYAVAGHLLEIGGYPLICAGAQLSSDGLTTMVHVTSPFLRGFDPTVDAVKVSVRPIYPPGARDFLGVSPVVPTEEVRVVLYGEETPGGDPTPGRTLVLGRDYSFSADTGAVGLLAPVQDELAPGQRILISYTKLRALSPVLQDDTIVIPRYRAKYAHVVIPDADNGFLDSYLVGTYTFESPDSFYVRAVPLSTFMGEVAKVAADRVAARTPHGGPVVVSGPAQDNWTFGTVPLLTQKQDLLDQDRAARVFISLYDEVVQAFEQVKEAIDGSVVGDRDGKFRFFVGRDKTYVRPGYEDDITGNLVPRFVWTQVFESANGSFGVSQSDPIVDPATAVQDVGTLEVSGDPMNPWLLDYYVQEQKRYVLNDMDDLVLAGRGRATFLFPFSFEVAGDFKQMWEPSVVSRLYPESTLAFTTTYPGLLAGTLPGEPGVYSFLKLVERPNLLKGEGPVFGSTFGMDIGDVSNPAIGIIQNITGQVKPRARLARARIWAYSETGFPDLDALIGTDFGANPRPAIIATPLFLRDFPLTQETGLPDTTRLAANGGDLIDLSTGDYALSTPKWEAYNATEGVRPQVAFGKPNGETYSVGCASGTITEAFSGALPFTTPVYKGLFVFQVYGGCVLTFTSGDGNEITNAADIVRIDEDGSGTLEFGPEYGDTIYVIPPGSEDASGFADPPSVEDLKKFAEAQPTLDVGVRERRSAFVDWSLPSAEDPSFPIKEIVNQKTAKPLMPIEASVEFANTMRDPLAFPALKGEPTNDCGDYTLPYLTSSNTELDRLGAVQATFTSIVQTDSPTPEAVYPDEVVGNDGSILSAASGTTPPATLLSSRDFLPVTTAGGYVPRTGVADVRRYDLLLVETYPALPPPPVEVGVQGILSVGEVTSGTLEVPRFVTPSTKGLRTRYTFDNAMVHLSSTGVSGVVIEEVGATTTIDISTVGGLFLNDGSGAATGGLNNIVSNGSFVYGVNNNNIVTIEIIDQGTGLVLETVTVQGTNVTGGLGTVGTGAVTTFTDKVMTISAIGFVDFAALGGVAPGPVGPFDFMVSIDTFVAPADPDTGSITAYVGGDRLTFSEDVDLRTVMPRGSVTVGALSVQGALSVHRVTASGNDACTVDNPSSVNGGVAFTFLARDAGAPETIGSFDPSPGTGEGSVKVMAFEGDGNTPLPSTGSFTFSAMASSDQDENGVILTGTGDVYDDEDRVRSIPTPNDLANVVPGDVLVITESSVGDAAVTCGSYVIRHAVPDDGAGYKEVFPKAYTNTTDGWASSPFPKVVSASLAPFRIRTSAIQTVSNSPSGYDFAATGRLYLILDVNDLTTVVSVAYTAITPVGDEFVFTLTGASGRAADGVTVVSNVDVVAAAGSAVFVSGMVYVPIKRFPSPCPSNNTVGHDNGVTTAGGFVQVSLKGGASTYTFTYLGVQPLIDSTGAPPAAGELGVTSSDAVTTDDSTSFLSDVSTPVYRGVPLYLDLTGIDDPTVVFWAAIHGAGLDGVACLVPGMTLYGHDGSSTVTTGFRAQSGVFIEPSTPRPAFDLGNGVAKVVDATHSIGLPFRVGMRSPSSFGITSPETVSFSVRRVRRWHEVLDGLGENLSPLRYAYEIRAGSVDSYTAGTRTLVATIDPDSGGGTQLGDFDDQDVNINPGDTVRVLDASGTVLDSAEVAVVVDGVTLKLRTPGFTEYVPVGGETFQVYLRQAPVPHEQSNEQLLELITDEVILTRTADPVASTGGRSDTINELRDNGIPDFSTLDPAPQVGDIVLVDPAGNLSGPTGDPVPAESGVRPIGDQSVSTRSDGSHIAGGPSDLDDNRGWYRITTDPTTTGAYLAVSGETDFTGPDGAPVLLGATAPTNQQFAVYPDITGSALDPYGHAPSPATEGQMDLRPTKTSLPSNSYQDGSFKSIEPFSYRIIRPTRLFSSDTVDLVLMFRERMLSWMEEMEAATKAEKQGSYFVFQRDEHCSDLGSATDGDDGLGVPSNVFISGLSGLTQYAPFANTSDCLSVLDRRNWCLDTRLDRETPPWVVGADPYTSLAEDNSAAGYTVGSGRPVEPDLIDGVLDRTDRLRDLRYAWIKFRANQENGTLPSIERFLADLPRLLQEQVDFLRMQQSISDARSE